MKSFWESKIIGRIHEMSMSFAESGIVDLGFQNRKTSTYYYQDGSLKEELTVQSILDKILAAIPNSFIAHHVIPTRKTGDEKWYLATDDFAVCVDYTHHNRSICISTIGLNEKHIMAIRSLCATGISRKVTKGRVYIVIQKDSGPALHEIGAAGEDFIKENYRPEVAKEYEHIVNDLNSSDPCGRIVLLDGPAGTGKTHCIRALLNECPKGTFILIPSNMVSSLGSPSFVKALLGQQRKGYPMILIVEDADQALVSRESSKGMDTSEISALLNFSDGIFGALMDIRIVATTNATIDEIDSAVLRDGRLCRRIEVTKLDHIQAEAVYKRLTEKDSTFFTKGNFYTLGEVYRVARGDEHCTALTKKKAKGNLGFSIQAEEPETDEYSSRELDRMGVRDGRVIITDEGTLLQRQGNELRTVTEEDLEDDLEDEDTFPSIFEDDDLVDEDPPPDDD